MSTPLLATKLYIPPPRPNLVLRSRLIERLAAILTALLNDITALPNHVLLVLDDYQAMKAKPVDDVLAFLVEHLPPHMHLILATREDPPLPLARLRARNHLTELRAADLRFTVAETAEFLTQVMGLRLSAADIATLEERAEGWIAGLQLAALSMQGQHDTTELHIAARGVPRHPLYKRGPDRRRGPSGDPLERPCRAHG